MSATISSINYCPVKSISFQSIDSCQIKKNIGISGDKIFDDPQNERTKQFLHAVLDAN